MFLTESMPVHLVMFISLLGFVVAGLLNALHQCKLEYQSIREVEKPAPIRFIINENNEIEYQTTQQDDRLEVQNGTGNANAFQSLRFNSPLEFLWSFIMCFLAGPYLLLDICIDLYKAKNLKPIFALAAFVFTIIWSFSAGLVLIETAQLFTA